MTKVKGPRAGWAGRLWTRGWPERQGHGEKDEVCTSLELFYTPSYTVLANRGAGRTTTFRCCPKLHFKGLPHFGFPRLDTQSQNLTRGPDINIERAVCCVRTHLVADTTLSSDATGQTWGARSKVAVSDAALSSNTTGRKRRASK